MKYHTGDAIIFKYMDRKRAGIIHSVYKQKNLKREWNYLYEIKDMSKDILIRENNILGKVLKNATKISKEN